MGTNRNEQSSSGIDPLIDEVRTIRRSVCDEFGNDVDRLCDHLQEIEQEYRTRTGRFAGVPRKLERELFPESAVVGRDALIDELRALRDKDSTEQR